MALGLARPPLAAGGSVHGNAGWSACCLIRISGFWITSESKQSTSYRLPSPRIWGWIQAYVEASISRLKVIQPRLEVDPRGRVITACLLTITLWEVLMIC